MDFLKVQGHDGLVRDTSTGAIVNTSKSDYEQYMESIRVAEEKERVISQHTDEINNMKNELREIKDLLLQLVNK